MQTRRLVEIRLAPEGGQQRGFSKPVAKFELELRHGLGEAPLLPTLWGKPYLNKAPGLHSLIALVISTTTQPDRSGWVVVLITRAIRLCRPGALLR